MVEKLVRKYPRRPRRLDLLFQNVQPLYFVTFNTHNRLAFLAQPQVHEDFVSFSLKAGEHNVAVGRYVIMPDHIHLFVAIPLEGITLERWIQSLRSTLGKILLRIGFQKPHWQEGFFDHVLRSSESYSEKWDYVRMNPVRAGLVQSPEDWPYQGEIVSLPFD